MAYWSAAFLLIAAVAGVMGMHGIGGLPLEAAGGLFLAALLLALFPLVLGQRQATPRRPAARRRRRA